MRILALIKYTLDVAEIRVDANTKELLMDGVPRRMGVIDKNVVEAAVSLKESLGGSVIGLCLGPKAAVDSFKDVLAMGLDEVYLVEDPFNGEGEPRVAASILEAAIRKLAALDLILCGFASDDGYTYQTPPRLSERLDLPLVSYARGLSVSDGVLQADRDLEDGLQRVQVSLPALVSVGEEAYPPRRTTLMDAIKAKKKPVHHWGVEADLGLKVDELAQLSQITSTTQTGVIVKRKLEILKGATPEELADRLIDSLLREGLLKGAALNERQ